MDIWLDKIKLADSIKNLDKIKLEIFGKNGMLTKAFYELKNLKGDDKKNLAKKLNNDKILLTNKIKEANDKLIKIELNKKLESEKIDVTKIDFDSSIGSIHPVSNIMNLITNYFQKLNFSIEEGPLVENEFNNFEALNIPVYHPARNIKDTFYNKDYSLLRTHTSPVQIRTMLEKNYPIKMIAPGTVFRRDFDITHTPMFNQIEGLVVDQEDNISFANLKYILEEFLHYIFGDVKIRFRPSFFPFTEPSAEVDISCVFCKSGCQVCSQTSWLEVLGCGIVNQNVFKHVKYEKVSGYAFGLGIERFTMLIHKVGDLRSLFESDLRLLGQFK